MLSTYQLQGNSAREASFLENKQKRKNGTKRVLHEMVEGLQELMDIDNSDVDDSPATVFFHESAENGISSEEDMKDAGHALADINVDDNDSDF